MFCSRCGSKNSDGTRFCSKCGQPFVKPLVPATEGGASTAGATAQVLSKPTYVRVPSVATAEVKNSSSLWLGVAGGAITVLAFFVPWFSTQVLFRGTTQLSGFNLADGFTGSAGEASLRWLPIIGLAVLVAFAVGYQYSWLKKAQVWIHLVGGLASIVVFGSFVFPIMDRAAQGDVSAQYSVGLLATLAGIAMLLLSGLMGVRQK